MTTRTIAGMAVEVTGAGTPVVMVHGLGGTSNTWTPQQSVFDGHFQMVCPDLPGSGRSADKSAGTLEDLIDAVTAVADGVGATSAHYVGHSMGTILCQHIAARHPDRVISLALFGPFPAPPDRARDALRQRAGRARKAGMAEIADEIVQNGTSTATRRDNPLAVALVREMIMRQSAEGYAATCEALSRAEAADLARISCPVLLMTGDEDAIAPPSTARAMDAALRDSRTSILPRCGHWTTFERVDDVNRELKEFLRRVH